MKSRISVDHRLGHCGSKGCGMLDAGCGMRDESELISHLASRIPMIKARKGITAAPPVASYWWCRSIEGSSPACCRMPSCTAGPSCGRRHAYDHGEGPEPKPVPPSPADRQTGPAACPAVAVAAAGLPAVHGGRGWPKRKPSSLPNRLKPIFSWLFSSFPSGIIGFEFSCCR